MRLRGGLLLVLTSLFLLGGGDAQHRITLAFLGDIMLGRGVAEAHAGDDWKHIFAPLIPELSKVDFSLANLESPLCSGSRTAASEKIGVGYVLTAPESALEALYPLHLKIVSLANNHSLDCGATGLAATVSALERMGIQAVVVDGQPIFVDTRRGRFAFLAFNDIGTGIDINKVTQAVTEARRSGAIVIVSLHWGLEYQPGANVRQRSQAQALADAGAAMIWGHHPHVLQPPAWVQGKGQPRPTLVLYSLGNAVFDQHAPPDAMRSAVVIVAFDNDAVVRMEIFPFVIDPRRGRIISASPAEIDLIYRRMKIDRQ